MRALMKKSGSLSKSFDANYFNYFYRLLVRSFVWYKPFWDAPRRRQDSGYYLSCFLLFLASSAR